MSVQYTDNFLAFKRDLNRIPNKSYVGNQLDKDTAINFVTNEDNRDRLILSVIPMVESLARQYANVTPARIEFEDLLQAGTIGSIIAADRWLTTPVDARISKNAKFSTMSYSWILKYIKEYIAGSMSILSHGVTKSYDAALSTVSSGDACISNSDDNNTTLFDMISNTSGIDDAETKEQLVFLSDLSKKMFSSLTLKEKRIIFAYFGIDREKPLHLDEIGQQLNISKSATFLIVNECIRKMSEIVKSTELVSYAAFMFGADLSMLEEWKSSF